MIEGLWQTSTPKHCRPAVNTTRRFVLRSVLLRPSVLIPLVGGLVAGAASVAVGGSLMLTSLAVVGIVGGAAWLVAGTVLNVEALTDQALAAQQQASQASENQQLDLLARQLRTDRDHRTQDTLTLLRSLREDFELAASRPGVERRSARFREQIGLVFQATVEKLRESYRLMQQSETVVGQPRQQFLDQRETVVAQAMETTNKLRDITQQFMAAIQDDSQANMESLQKELELSLEIAKRTEQRMKELENPSAQYESYIKE